MTIQEKLDLYAAATNRGALLPRVFALLSTSAADKKKILTALFHDMKNDKLRGDFFRLDASETAQWNSGVRPTEIIDLVEALVAGGV